MPAARWTPPRPRSPRHRLTRRPSAARRHALTTHRRAADAVRMGVLCVLLCGLAVGGGVALHGVRAGTPLWEAVPGDLPSTVGGAAGDLGGPTGSGGTGVPVTGAPADGRADIAIRFALAQRGIPYVWGGDGPAEGGWDCSGLTKAAFGAAGIGLPRTAHQQFVAGPHTRRPTDPAPGDLVFYGTPERIHHVGLSIGNGLMVHAPHSGTVVQVGRIHWPGDDYAGATRPAAPGTAVELGDLGAVTVPPGPAPSDPAPQGPVTAVSDTPTGPAPDPAVLAVAPLAGTSADVGGSATATGSGGATPVRLPGPALVPPPVPAGSAVLHPTTVPPTTLPPATVPTTTPPTTTPPTTTTTPTTTTPVVSVAPSTTAPTTAVPVTPPTTTTPVVAVAPPPLAVG